jgi:hypothetical protein
MSPQSKILPIPPKDLSVTYLRLRITTYSPSGRVWASRFQTSLFNSGCLHSASKILVLHSLRRQTACVPRSKFVSNCLYPKGFPVLRLLVLLYHKYCTMAQFIIRLPTALFHKSFALGRIFISLAFIPTSIWVQIECGASAV